MTNPVSRFEIYVNDMERAKTFYWNVFGRSERVDLSNVDMKMEMFVFPRADGWEWAAWALVKMEGSGPAEWCGPAFCGTLVYFTCEDCAVEESKVEANGGKVFKPKMNIGEFGFIAIVQDTEGNTIGLHSMK